MPRLLLLSCLVLLGPGCNSLGRLRDHHVTGDLSQKHAINQAGQTELRNGATRLSLMSTEQAGEEFYQRILIFDLPRNASAGREYDITTAYFVEDYGGDLRYHAFESGCVDFLSETSEYIKYRVDFTFSHEILFDKPPRRFERPRRITGNVRAPKKGGDLERIRNRLDVFYHRLDVKWLTEEQADELRLLLPDKSE